MIIHAFNTRFNMPLFADSRLVNRQPHYCLCTNCVKTAVEPGETQVCQRHDEFIRFTDLLLISAPVFACPDFEQRKDGKKTLDYTLITEELHGNSQMVKIKFAKGKK